MIAVAVLLLPSTEGVGFDQPVAKGRGLPDEVCVFIGGGLLRARERRFNQSAVLYSKVRLAEVAHDDDIN